MARHKLTQEDIEDIEDVESNDPYLRHLISRHAVAGEYDEEYG